jgi:hypothetical protein
MAVKYGTPSTDQLRVASNWLRGQLKALGIGCGKCHLCQSRKKPTGERRRIRLRRLVVSRQLSEYQGKKGIAPMHVKKAKRVQDTVCLLVQALFACASARIGVDIRVGENVYVWRRCKIENDRGEWLGGDVVAYDPVSVAHFLTFQRIRPGGTVHPATEADGWLQLWRSGEWVMASPPPEWR